MFLEENILLEISKYQKQRQFKLESGGIIIGYYDSSESALRVLSLHCPVKTSNDKRTVRSAVCWLSIYDNYINVPFVVCFNEPYGIGGHVIAINIHYDL